jgi:hypothetical protein
MRIIRKGEEEVNVYFLTLKLFFRSPRRESGCRARRNNKAGNLIP